MTNCEKRLPVTLLTGFLGAGKTTLLNQILSAGGGPKIAVIVNEFGEAGLDHDLIEAVEEDVVLMQSGCLCCSVRGDLSRTLQDLVFRRKTWRVKFDRIVIETTGLADPGPILQTFVADPFLASKFHVDGVVTVADAAAGPDTMDRQFEAVSQVALADLLVVSKSDLVTGAALTAFEERLRALNPSARLIRADHGNVPLSSLWNLSGMRRDAAPEHALSWLTPKPLTGEAPDAFTNLSGLAQKKREEPLVHAHDARIGSASIVLEAPIPAEAFDLWLDTLIKLRGPDILRVKGVVHLQGFKTPFVFHGVQHLFDPPVPVKNWPKGDHQSRIVVIARDITNPELNRSLDMLRGTQNTKLRD